MNSACGGVPQVRPLATADRTSPALFLSASPADWAARDDYSQRWSFSRGFDLYRHMRDRTKTVTTTITMSPELRKHLLTFKSSLLDTANPARDYLTPAMVRSSTGRFAIDEHLHASVETIPLDCYAPESAPEAAAQWSVHAGNGINTSITMLRRLMALKGMCKFMVQEMRTASGSGPPLDINGASSDPCNPYYRHRMREIHQCDYEHTKTYNPELWIVAERGYWRTRANAVREASSKDLRFVDTSVCSTRIALLAATGKLLYSDTPLIATNRGPRLVAFDQDVLCLDMLLRPFMASYRFLEGIVLACVDSNDESGVTLRDQWDLNMREIQYSYRIPLPGMVAVAPSSEESLATLWPPLAEFYQTRKDPPMARVYDFFARGYGVMGTCLWRLQHLHRMKNVATQYRDSALYHQTQLMIDMHLSLWSRCVTTNRWSDVQLCTLPLECTVSQENLSRIPDITKPEHPCAPAQLTVRGIALANAFRLKMCDSAGNPLPGGDYGYVPEWMSREVKAALGKAAPQAKGPTSSSSSNGKKRKAPDEQQPEPHPQQETPPATPQPSSGHTVSAGPLLELFWPLSTDVVTWEKSADLTPLLVHDAIMYESLLDSMGINDSVGGAGGFGTSSSVAQDTDRGNNADHITRGSAMRLFVTRVLPHRAGGTAHTELPNKCIEPYPALAFMLSTYLQVFMYGNYPYTINRPDFGTRVRTAVTMRDVVGGSTKGITNLIAKQRPLVDRALMETLVYAIGCLPALETALRKRPNYGLWALAAETNGLFTRSALSKIPLCPTDKESDVREAYKIANSMHWKYIRRVLDGERSQLITLTAEKSRKATFIEMITSKMRKVTQSNMRDSRILMGEDVSQGTPSGSNRRTRRGASDYPTEDDEDEDDGYDDNSIPGGGGGGGVADDATVDEYDEMTMEYELLAALGEFVEEREGDPRGSSHRPLQNRRMREVEETVSKNELYRRVVRYFPEGFDESLAVMLAERSARTAHDRRNIEWWPLEILGVHPNVVATMRHWAYYYNIWDRTDNSFTDLVELLWRAYPRSWSAVYYYLCLHNTFARDRTYALPESVARRQREAIATLYRLPSTEHIGREDLRGVFYRCPVCTMWAHPVAPHGILNYVSFEKNPVTGRRVYIDPCKYASLTRLQGTKKELVRNRAKDKALRSGTSSTSASGIATPMSVPRSPALNDYYNSYAEDDDEYGDDRAPANYELGTAEDAAAEAAEERFRRDVHMEGRLQSINQSSGLTVAPGIYGKMPVTFMKNSAGTITNAASSQVSSSMLTGAAVTTDSAGLHTTGVLNAQTDIQGGFLRCTLAVSRRPQNILHRGNMSWRTEPFPLYDDDGFLLEDSTKPPGSPIRNTDYEWDITVPQERVSVTNRLSPGTNDPGLPLSDEISDSLPFREYMTETIARNRFHRETTRDSDMATYKTVNKALKKELKTKKLGTRASGHHFGEDLSTTTLLNEAYRNIDAEGASPAVKAAIRIHGSARERTSVVDLKIDAEPKFSKKLTDILEDRVSGAKSRIPSSVTRARCCNIPLQPIALVGRMITMRNRTYTVCAACGSLMLYAESSWVAGYGPVCQCHGVSAGGFDVKTGTLIPSPFSAHRNNLTLDHISAPGSFRMRPCIYITHTSQLNSLPAAWLLKVGYRTPLEALARERLDEFSGLPNATLARVAQARAFASENTMALGPVFESNRYPVIHRATGLHTGARVPLPRSMRCSKCSNHYWMQTVISLEGKRYCMRHHVEIHGIFNAKLAQLARSAAAKKSEANPTTPLSPPPAKRSKPSKPTKRVIPGVGSVDVDAGYIAAREGHMASVARKETTTAGADLT